MRFNVTKIEAPKDYMKQVCCENFTYFFRDNNKEKLDLIYLHHHGTLTSVYVQNVEGITITNL